MARLGKAMHMRLPMLRRAMSRVRVPPPATRVLLACATFALATFLLVCGLVLIEERQDTTERAGIAASQIAAAVAQDIEHGIGAYDGVLQALIVALRTPGINELGPPLRNQLLFGRLIDTRYLGFIEALDASGDVIASYPPAQRVTNWASRDYFVAHRRDASLNLRVSRPFATAQDEFATIALSRRIPDADGNFSGVVVIGVRLGYFRDLFNKLELGANQSIALLRDDGAILVSRPYDRNDVGRIADAASPFGHFMRSNTPVVTALDVTDHANRQYAFRRIADLHLVLQVGLATDNGASSWRFGYLVTAGAMLSFVCLLLLRRLWSELQQRETAERESRGRASLLATLSHELRTPLHGILGYAEQLRHSLKLVPPQSRHLASIVSAGQHMRSVVDWALDSAWLEARGPELHMAPVDLRQLVEQCRAIIEPSATAHGLSLTCLVAPGVPNWFVTDSALLCQILLNLLDNAVKYTREGGVELRLTDSEERIAIEVADSGIGIPVEQRHKLFHDYERLGAEHSAVEGTGLGLAIAARLVRRMGGDVGFRANPMGGSIFWINLPMGQPDALPTPANDAGVVTTARLRVLVVDDTAAGREIAAALLESEGHDVLQAKDGLAAVQLASTHDIDLVLMDMRMAGMDGLEATRRIRAIAGPRGQVPIVAMTANALDQHVARCLRAGMVGHLPKPFGRVELGAIIARVAAVQPTIDHDICGQLRRCMTPDALDKHLGDLAERIAAFVRKLTDADAFADPQSLADMAHELAGSAGTLGLQQLSDAARRFQQTLETEPLAARRMLDEILHGAESALIALRGYGATPATDRDSFAVGAQ
jgi:signal transduction histidine kinase/DNA-binding NarL/FixJ family response regulator